MEAVENGTMVDAADGTPGHARRHSKHGKRRKSSHGHSKQHDVDPNAAVSAEPEQKKGAFFAFLKQLATTKGDLSSISAPALVMCGSSLLEFSIDFMAYPDLFVQIPKEQTQERTS